MERVTPDERSVRVVPVILRLLLVAVPLTRPGRVPEPLLPKRPRPVVVVPFPIAVPGRVDTP